MAAENNLHQGHRERMRERIAQQGFESLADHEALEVPVNVSSLNVSQAGTGRAFVRDVNLGDLRDVSRTAMTSPALIVMEGMSTFLPFTVK